MKLFTVLKSDLKRTIKDKPTLILFAGMLILTLLYMIIGYFGGGIEGLDEASLKETAYSSLLGGIALSLSSGFPLAIVIIFPTLAVSLFLAKDYSYHTIRNKIMCGKPRFGIYLSTLLYNFIITFIFLVANFLLAFILSGILYGASADYLSAFLLFMVSLVPYLGVIALSTFVCMTIKRPAISVIVNLLILIFLFFALYMFAVLLGNDGFVNFIELFPHIAANMIYSYNILSPTPPETFLKAIYILKLSAFSLTLGTLITLLGTLLFSKTDIK